MKIKTIKESDKVLELPGILGQVLQSSDNVEIVHLQIESGKSIPAHEMPLNVTFHVLEGELTLTVEDKTIKLKQGQFIQVKPNLTRATKNETDGLVRIMVVKEPL